MRRISCQNNGLTGGSILRLGSLFVALAAALAALAEETVQLTGAGDAPGVGAEARRNAIANARDRLLIGHLEFWSDSAELSKLAPILERSPSYFRNLRVVRQTVEGDSTHVEVQADLLVDQLRRDVSTVLLPSLDRKPTVIVIVQDDFGEDGARSMIEEGVAEKALRKVLRDAGFTVVKPEQLRGVLGPEKLIACVGGADTVAAEAARSLFADAAVIGRATVSVADDSRLTNLFRNRGSVALRIVRAADDAITEELADTGVVESREPALGGSMAVEDACEKIGPRLVSGIVVATLFTPEDDALRLAVKGPSTDQDREDMVAWLENLRGMNAVEVMASDAGLMRLRLDFNGDIAALVEQFDRSGYVRVTRVLEKNITAERVTAGGDANP
jgi:hypothetical protein